MPLFSTKQSFFLSGKEIAGCSKNCVVPKDFEAIFLLRRGCFTPVPMSRGTRFQGNLDKRRALFQIFTTRESLLTYLAVGVQSEVIIGDLRLLVTSVYF